jgi:glycolate oxidase
MESTAPSASEYSPLSESVLAELREIVGEGFVIAGDPDRLEPFSHDEIPDRRYARMPEAVVRPRTAEEISAILRLANRERIAVTPRGAGSGLSGGAVPLCGGIVLYCDRMNEILEVDLENMMVVVEPGVVTSEINEVLAEHGLFYAGYPMSLETCYIGGNVAENAGGGKAIKYGVTGRYVLGVEVVTPAGEIVQFGGKLVKDVTGYNLVQLMVGSEGTLGVITRVILKLLPAPTCEVNLLALFKTAEEAISTVPRIQADSGVIPTAIEFMDRSAFHSACEYLNETFPYRHAGAMLLITADGNDEQRVFAEAEAVGELCLARGALEVYVADNATTSERVWKVRRNIAESYNALTGNQSNEDLVVPPAAIAAMVQRLQALAEKYEVMIPCFGHAGDGNLHARIVMNPEWELSRWQRTLPGLLDELYAQVRELGGRISGEHGIGHKRKHQMPGIVGENYLELCRALKRAWDPNHILNPGKIFDMT